MNLEADRLDRFSRRLRSEIAGDVHLDRHQRALYATDASLYQIEPAAVVVPRDAEDAVRACRAAAEHGVPIIPRGGGTSLSGQPIGAGMVLDFSKSMNRILAIDPDRRIARVQPGVVLDQLNKAAAAFALQFGPDVSTGDRANIGGMIGNNSAGSRSIRQGKTVDHVIELDVVLSDGSPVRFGPLSPEQLAQRQLGDTLDARVHREVERIVRTYRDDVLAGFPRVLRRVSGYNLDEFIPETRVWYPPPYFVEQVRQLEAQRYPGANFNLARLIAGSEGTLATIVEAEVHLIPLPPERAIVVLHFDSLEASCDALAAVLALEPSAAEFFDRMIIDLARRSLEYRKYLDFVVGEPESLIVVEFSGDSPAEVRDKVALLMQRLQGFPGLFHMLPAVDPQMRDHIWACRKAALPLLMGVPGKRKPVAFVEDTAVDPARLPQFARKFRRILQEEDADGAFYGHASVGCLHIRPMIDAADPGDLAKLQRISLAVCDLVIEYGGSMSGEHGDGLARSYLNERLFGPRLYQAFKEVKAAFDPHGLLNPGKVVDGPSPIENLRQGAEYRTLPVETVQDFSRQGGFAAAVELCNGSGVCRKLQTGTMCPSFMVTRDEEHSTRGRANALRLVLSGALPPEELTGRKLFETYDLCLQCKGCKAECPSNVDVAKLKTEFLHQYYGRHGTPLGVRAMGHVAWLNRIGSALAPVSNWALKMPGAAWLQEKLLGVDRRRSIPPFAREHFARWFHRRNREPGAAVGNGRATPSPGSRGKIVLLDDCLTSFCEPQVNRAAVQVLEAAGYEVVLAGLPCCGRAMISKGLLREARELAEANIERLAPLAQQGLYIVGSEPSCLLTLTDEYRDLVPGAAAELVASQSRLIDTHLMREGIQLPLKPAAASQNGGTVGAAGNTRSASAGGASPGSKPEQGSITEEGGPWILHGHCHQKALVGAQDTRRLLETIPGVKVKLLDSGCCGMAGSFGYEHYDVSMQIGERVLFPEVRNAGGCPVAAPGFSCRHQIADGTGRHARHPLELLADHLEDPKSQT